MPSFWNASRTLVSALSAVFFATTLTALAAHAATANPSTTSQDRIQTVLDASIRPLLEKYNIPGMAVGLVVDGRPYFFNYGIASKDTGLPVSQNTLFELGSLSKTFTATAAAQAQRDGKLSLTDKTSQYLPALAGHPFGDVTLLSLGTHTPGGLPLQVPDAITNNKQLLQYFEQWQPSCKQGTCRTYANPGIGTLGLITAKAVGKDFTDLMQNQLFPALGLKNSYIDVPKAKTSQYAQGYTTDDAPARMAIGVLSSEAYGIKSSAVDMTRFMLANMHLITLEPSFEQAILDTHTGYFQAGGMTQDLIWEQYPWPVKLEALQAGNSASMIYEATPVTAIEPPQKPRTDVLINKTGGTRGFGSYMAFVPEQRVGIVMLANKNYPNAARVEAAHRILTELTGP